MEAIKLCHLYYDLMNLYGESGNLKALKKVLEQSGVKTEIHFVSKETKIDFKKYDFYYLGSGSEENQKLILKDLLKYKDEIKKAVEANKIFLVTGNAIELFGKYIEDLDGKKNDSLAIFDYYTKVIDFRIIGEQLYTSWLMPEKVIGFQNRGGVIKESRMPLFKVVSGTGYEPKSENEGYTYKNFYGTYLLGPLLIRNPFFCDFLANKIFEQKNIKYELNRNRIDYKAYDEYLKNFVN